MHNIHYIQIKTNNFSQALVKVQNILESDETLTSDNYFRIEAIINLDTGNIKIIDASLAEMNNFNLQNIYKELKSVIEENRVKKPMISDFIKIYKYNPEHAWKMKIRTKLKIQEIRDNFNEYIDALFVNTSNLSVLEYKPYEWIKYGKTNIDDRNTNKDHYLVVVNFHS